MEVNDGWKGELDGVASFVVSVLGQKCERNELFFAVSNYARSEELAWSEPGSAAKHSWIRKTGMLSVSFVDFA